MTTTETKTGQRLWSDWLGLTVIVGYIILSIPYVWDALKNSVDFVKLFFYTYLKISFT